MVVGLPIGKGSGVRALKEVVGENKLWFVTLHMKDMLSNSQLLSIQIGQPWEGQSL
jgi:hypothetical protein